MAEYTIEMHERTRIGIRSKKVRKLPYDKDNEVAFVAMPKRVIVACNCEACEGGTLWVKGGTSRDLVKLLPFAAEIAGVPLEDIQRVISEERKTYGQRHT